jgi:hypothetical protein
MVLILEVTEVAIKIQNLYRVIKIPITSGRKVYNWIRALESPSGEL